MPEPQIVNGGTSGVQRRAALARPGIRGRRKHGTEFACGQGVEGAKAGVEFGISEPPAAVKEAEKVFAGAFAFLGVAFDACGDEVAVGVAAAMHAGHNMVNTASAR